MYNHKEIEKKWQKFWRENKIFKTENPVNGTGTLGKVPISEKPKYYCLDMFPYPSGAGLHVGHPEGYTANDIVARYKHTCGYNVLHPMGWDAFGLPAENYAIKTGTHPRITTDQNIQTFKKQIQSLGFSYDWDREIDTTDPKYYKWTQWIFLKLFEHGLAYEQDLPINYCPSCKTGLANEEVLNDFTCDRCGTKVEKRKIKQWVLAITKYAERLLHDVDKLDWPEGIKDMQRNWIGKSEGCEFRMERWSDDKKQMISEDKNLNDKTYKIIGIAMKVQNELGPGLEEKVYKKAFKIILEKEGFSVKEEIKNPILFEGEEIGFGKIDLLIDDAVVIELKSQRYIKPEHYKQLRKYLNQSTYQTGFLMNFYGQKLDYKRFEKDYHKISSEIIGNKSSDNLSISVYTTRIDTVFGMTYAVLAPDHPQVMDFITPDQKEACLKYIEDSKKKSDQDRTADNKEKTGVFTGSYIINPYNNEKVPLWIADYVLGNYGTGAVMAVPAHDERDFEFARKYGLEIKTSIVPTAPNILGLCIKTKYPVDNKTFEEIKNHELIETIIDNSQTTEFYIRKGMNEQRRIEVLLDFFDERNIEIVNVKIFSEKHNLSSLCWFYEKKNDELVGLNTEKLLVKLTDFAEKNGFGHKKINYKLRDWLFSRQRYWGEPIPLIHLQKEELENLTRVRFIDEKTPYVILDGQSSPRSDNNIFEFETVSALIQHPEKEEFLVLEFNNGECGLVGGALESGENEDEAIMREIQEETGYKNMEIKEVIFEKAYGRGYKSRKDREEKCIEKIYLVKLKDLTQDPHSGEGEQIKNYHWLNKKDCVEKISLRHHKFYAEYYFSKFGEGDYAYIVEKNPPIPNPFPPREKGDGDEKYSSFFEKTPDYITKLSQELRKNPTKTEEIMWEILRGKNLGVKFRRQHPFCRYIADFYSDEQKLVIEIDGGIHESAKQKEYDEIRDEIIQKYSVKILRIKNEEIKNDLENVIQKIITSFSTPFSLGGKGWDRGTDGKAGEYLYIGGKEFSRIYDGLYTKMVCDYNLPLKLPQVDDYEPSGDGNSPLAKIESFVNVKLAENLSGKRETNTMPQWGGSCWYYLRYMDPHNENELVNPEIEKYWGQVDSYVGGAEHAVLHLLYARFWHKFLFDIGVVSSDEPFYRLRNQGLILAHAFQRKNGGLVANDLVEEKNGKYYLIETGEELNRIVSKMSKSLKNVVNPDEIVNEYGADALRLYEMYMADFKDAAPWDTKGIVGVSRFLDKVWRLFMEEKRFAPNDEEAMKILHKTIKKVGEDIENYKFNTAIAQLIICLNTGLPKDENLQSEWKEKFLLLLHPFAPHIAEELFQNLKKNEIKKAYFATGNKNKFSRLQMVIEKNNLSFSISEYKDYKEVEETGITPLENTLQKLEPYKNTKRDFPIIATDSGMYFDGIEENPTYIKRNALQFAGLDEKSCNQEQIAEAISEYYKKLAKENGGKLDFYYEDAWGMLMSNNQIITHTYKRPYILTDKENGPRDIYFPMRNLYISKVTGKYACEQTEEDTKKEFDCMKEMLEKLFGNSIFFASWPVYDEKMTIDDTIKIGVQVNGKLRGDIEIMKDEKQEEALKKAKENPDVKKWIEGHEIIKEIYVPGRIVNIIVK